MRHLMFAALPFAFSALANAAAPVPQPAQSEMKIHNIANTFADFWDANKDKPKAEQLAAFKAQAAAVFPRFYDIKRFEGRITQEQLDERIEGAIKSFPNIRSEYLAKAEKFESELPGYIASFKTWFPDYRPTHEVYVLHSLGEMDGGTRTIDGKDYLIFGVDGLVVYHRGTRSQSAFFHHELFHTYHKTGCQERRVWSSLWNEGLATYVAKTMNPTANNQELLLAFPKDLVERTDAALPAAFEHLEKVLDNGDYPTYAGLFSGGENDKTGLPARRGYYLGMLVAQEAAKTHTVQELAKLQCDQVKELVHSTVRTLRTGLKQ